jgi:hypothetical protein
LIRNDIIIPSLFHNSDSSTRAHYKKVLATLLYLVGTTVRRRKLNMTRVLKVILSFVATILVGTLLVLSTVVVHFGVDQNDVITEAEMGSFERAVVYDQSLIQQANYFSVISDPTTINSTGIPVQETDGRELHQDRRDDQQDSDNAILRRRIPKIIHQTWKVAEIPQKWQAYRDECQVLHPD